MNKPVRSLRNLLRTTRSFELTWRYLYNLAPTLTYRFDNFQLSDEGSRILAGLNRDGVALTSASSLFGSDTCYSDLYSWFEQLRDQHSEALEIARREAASNEGTKKNFIYEYLGHHPMLAPAEIAVRFALHQRVLEIANAYLGMYTRLRYINVWHTFASLAAARQSQLWHRDREDRYILKVFVYLSEVDEASGPFTYAPGTHGKGNISKLPASFVEGGVHRTSDDQMAEVVPANRWINCLGPRGTIVFADTRGYHKGGLARKSDRIIYTCMFTSPASESEEFFRRPEIVYQPATRGEAFALAQGKSGLWLNFRTL